MTENTPPADDVREALAREIEPTAWTEVQPHPTVYADDPEARAQYEAYFYEGQRDRRAPSLATADRLLSSLTFEVRPRGTVTEAEVADVVDPERTPAERFADAAAAQFSSDLDYDGAEIKRRILTLAHVLTPDHPKTAAECDVCRDDDKVDGL